MSARSMTCVTVECDGCGTTPDSDGMIPHYGDAEEARSALADEREWWSDGEALDYCGQCRVLKCDGWVTCEDAPECDCCGRCTVERDDHDGVPAPAAGV